MALRTKASNASLKVSQTIETIDTNGNNYLGTVPPGYRGATIMVTVVSGSATGLTAGKATTLTKNDTTPTVISYENGAITATGGDVSVNSGTNADLYLVVAGASSLDADVEVDMFT